MMMWFNNIDISWYHYIIAGFCLGVYIHSHRIRHWLHLLATMILRGFIWMLQRTDHYYKVPRVKSATTKPLPMKDYSKTGLEVSQEELAKWLENSEVSVAER